MTLQWILLVYIFGAVFGHPLNETLEVDLSEEKLTCHYKGTEYLEGETILIEEPCLSCTCHTGSLVCSLRVCPDLPNPPPSGCVIVQKKDHCCPQLLCENPAGSQLETGSKQGLTKLTNGCRINGSVYSEGSALSSSSLCEFCYCIQGQQKCIKPHCAAPEEGCVPNYSQHSCCPTHYDCSATYESAERGFSNSRENSECLINGTRYSDGDMVPTEASCDICYCIRNTVQCSPVRCTIQQIEGCYPVYTQDRCCPHAYNCSKPYRLEESKISANMVRSLRTENLTTSYQNSTEVPIGTTTLFEAEEESTTVTEQTTTDHDENVTDETTVVGNDDVTTDSITTTTSDQVFENTTSVSGEETTEIFESPITSTTFTSDVITAPPDMFSVDLSSNMRMDLRNRTPGNEEAVKRAQPLDLDDLLANATHSDEDYDAYDYSEPRLPPSLPNLVIFRFVAADAVTKEEQTKKEEAEKNTAEVPNPVYYKNFFSPPIETEGGFVPKDDPLPETVTYETSYFNEKVPEMLHEEVQIENTPPSITMPPKSKSELCVSEGKEYRHGELTSMPGECISCVCFYGEVICQEANCPTPPPGCSRTAEKELNSCCSKIACDTVEIVTTSRPPDFTILAPNFTAVALEPMGISENPFPDVIRTEPAPDLPSLMGEILPFLLDQQTNKPVSVNYKNVVVNYYPKHQITTTRENDQKTTMTIEETPVFASSTEPYKISNFDFTSVSPIYKNTHRTEHYHFTTENQWEKATEKPPATTPPPSPSSTAQTPVTHVQTEKTFNTTPERTEFSTKSPLYTKSPLLGTRPKPPKNGTTSTTTEPDSFLDEFLKGFFENSESSSAVTPPVTNHPKLNHKYSSKIRATPTFPTTSQPSVEIIQNREGEETETGSFSLDSVLHMLFDSETTEASTIRIGTKPKNQTYKYTRRPLTRKTKRPTPVTVPMATSTEAAQPNTTLLTTEFVKNETKLSATTVKSTSVVAESSFVTDQETGFPKINILHQELRKGPKPSKSTQESVKGVVSKQTETARKPTKASGGLGGILKLAGCNIYGRMYRVGKIIAELTNPCLECMCTENGVQCSKLVC